MNESQRALLKEQLPNFLDEENNPLSDCQIAAALNTAAGYTVVSETADKDAVLAVASAVTLGIMSADSPIQQKWLAIINPLVGLLSGATGRISKSRMQALDVAIADGLISEADAYLPWTKTNASLSEHLFGSDFFVTEPNVGEARNS